MKHPILRKRRGTVLITALVCLLIVMSLLGTMLVGALRISRQLRVERDRRQCELLLEAGLDRAFARVAAAEPYTGETWNVPADQIIERGDGRLTIEVAPAGDAPRRIHVVAEYPLGSERSIRRSRTVHHQPTQPQSHQPQTQE
jgi:hypothetical protein